MLTCARIYVIFGITMYSIFYVRFIDDNRIPSIFIPFDRRMKLPTFAFDVIFVIFLFIIYLYETYVGNLL